MENTLYISRGRHFQDAFICIDYDRSRNDSCPSKWRKLEVAIVNGTNVYKTPIDTTKIVKKHLEYKIKFVNFKRNQSKESNWKTVVYYSYDSRKLKLTSVNISIITAIATIVNLFILLIYIFIKICITVSNK